MKRINFAEHAVVIGIGLPAFNVAQAEEWKVMGQFGWFGVGKAHQIEKAISIESASSAGHSSMTRAKAAPSTWPA